MLRILLIRHGECYMNLDLADKIGGRSNDSPLTPLGQKQARRLGTHLHSFLVNNGYSLEGGIKAFSSTAVRSVDTARLALEAIAAGPLPSNECSHVAVDLVLSNELLEQDMGQWEGALRSQCYTPETLACIAADTHNYAAPGGESQRQVEERIMRYLLETVLPATVPGRPSFVFGHGMAFKCVLRHVLDSDARMSRKIAIGNTAITELGFVPDGGPCSLQPGWHILRVNDMAHLLKDTNDDT